MIQLRAEKVIKAGNMLIINDGDITIDSDDDSVHCNSEIYIYGGTINAATGDDGVHADDLLTVQWWNNKYNTVL